MDRSSEHQPLLSSEYPGAAAEALPPASSSSSGGVMSSVDLARQRAADEALARQLQDQERADPSYQEAEEGRFLAAAVVGGQQPDARAQVRHAMLTELFTSARVTAIGFWAIAALNLPQVALILYFSIADADKFNSCDRPVSLWLIFHGVRLLLSVVVAGLPLYNARRFHPYTMRYRRLTDTMNMLGLFVFVWGNFTVFDSRSCPDENPHIWKLSYVLLIIQYIVMLLPCALLMCLAPCVCCCLPLLIRVSGYLPVGVGLRMPGVQGASQTLIDKLPKAKKYERGMFGGPTTPPVAAQQQAPGSPTTNHDEPECSICLSNYTIGESVRQLPCQGHHHFHQACIDDWLKINACCPLDREALLPLMEDPARARERDRPSRPAASSAGAPARPAGASASSNASAPRTSSPATQRREVPSASSASYQQEDVTGSEPSSRRGSGADAAQPSGEKDAMLREARSSTD